MSEIVNTNKKIDIKFDKLGERSHEVGDVNHIDYLVSPMCFGEPHQILSDFNLNTPTIPIIYVRENKTCVDFDYNQIQSKDYMVENYLEAAGLLLSLREGVQPQYVRSD